MEPQKVRDPNSVAVEQKQIELTDDEGDEASYLVQNGTVDYHGRRANKSKTGGWLTAPLIFGAEMCERMSAFGIGLNLVTYLVGNLHLTRPFSANIVTNVLGTAFMTTLIGGFLADTWFGRYLTIAVFSLIQFSGLILITLFASLPVFWQPSCSPSNCQPVHGADIATLYIALYLIALGTGGIKSSVSAFGADQFDPHDPKEKEQMTYFFNWFFFFINMDSLLAVTVLVYVQDTVGRGWGFGITCASMLVAVVGSISGRKSYRYSIPQGSPFTRIACVLVAAFKNRQLELPSNPTEMLHEVHGDIKNDPKYDFIKHTDQFL